MADYIYRNLEFIRYQRAAIPYSNPINAFAIEKGWHIQYILSLTAGSVIGGICVAAIASVAQHSFESGLAAGSYALGLAAILLALLTLLSTIM